MKAVVVDRLDGPDALRVVDVERPVPVPGRGEVAIDVAATALNFMDTLITRGRYQIKPELPFSPGAECAGVVSAVGQDAAASWQVGDRVMAYTGYGAARATVIADAERLVRVPDTVPLTTAAGLTVTYGTALYALATRCGLGGTDRDASTRKPVLAVLGASGGAGQAAVEIGVLLGCDVIACASSVERCERAIASGARRAIGYADADLKQTLREATDGAGPDLIYDCVGGPYAEPALRALRPGGDYIVIGFAAGDVPQLPANIILLKDCTVHGIHWGADVERRPAAHVGNMERLLTAIADGHVAPRPPEVRPFEDAADAIRALDARKVIGKIVLTP
ncbi:MAG: NADPH:quinone oxidoreductase family protein [Pseudomonadota bacterium]